MEIPKNQILDVLRSTGEQDKADKASGELPDTVDTDRDADLLARLGIDPKTFLGDLGGGLPNL